MKRPNFFIVGAPRCGTTAMYEWLKQHPQIFMPEEKEPCYFGSDLRFRVPRITYEKYLGLFSGRNEKRIGEASPVYLVSKNAAKEIMEFNPSSRIIIMLRNPVDMMYSLYSQNLHSTNNEVIKDFATALEAEEERKKGLRIPASCYLIEVLLYKEMAKYADQVKRYLDIFGQEHVKVIIFDDFKNDPAGVYKSTLQFLGVDEDFSPKSFEPRNQNQRIRSTFLRGLPKNRAIRAFSKVMLPSRNLRAAISKKIQELNLIYEPRQPMDPKLRYQLQMEFAPEVRRLSHLIKRDLSYWCG